MPTVSVIVPNYNHARFLPKRIESSQMEAYGAVGMSMGEIGLDLQLIPACPIIIAFEKTAYWSRQPRASLAGSH